MTEIDSFKLIAREGDRVRYVPNHASGDANHPECEDGTISSFGETCVRVKFDHAVQRFGWDGTTAQSCYVGNLRVL